MREEGEVFVANLLDIKQSTVRADVRFLEVVDPVNDRCACRPCYSVVIRLPDTAKSGNISLDEIMLCKI